MNIAASALSFILDASQGGSACAGPATGALANIASTLTRGDGAGSNPITGFGNQIADGLFSSALTGGVAGCIAGLLA